MARGAGDLAEIVKVTRRVVGMGAGQHHAQHVRRPGGVAGAEHADDGGLLPVQSFSQVAAAADRQRFQFILGALAFGFERAQLAGGVRNGALRFTQRVARLAPCRFFLVELGLEGFDAPAQRA